MKQSKICQTRPPVVQKWLDVNMCQHLPASAYTFYSVVKAGLSQRGEHEVLIVAGNTSECCSRAYESAGRLKLGFPAKTQTCFCV